MTTATRTILFTDLANYTAAVARADREGLRTLLRSHEDLVRPLVEQADGTVVKNIGDSFLCTFGSATDALRVALAIHEEARARLGAGIRIALTTGDVEEMDDDVFGQTVNLTSRILDKTPAGEIWFGEGTRACMLDAEIPWESVGKFALKGIPGDQECFRMVPPDRVWLPHAVVEAARGARLARIGADGEVPELATDPVLLFEGLESGSEELDRVMSSLPVLDPAALFLSVYALPTSDRLAWTGAGRGIVVGTREAIDAALERVTGAEQGRRREEEDDSETINISRLRRVEAELTLCGLALPAVPLSGIVETYSYELQRDGTWATQGDDSLLRVEVRPDGVTLRALAPDVRAGGRVLDAGDAVALSDASEISTPAGRVRFVPARDAYRGVMLTRATKRLGLEASQTAELGRRPSPPGLAFPNRPETGTIRWCSGALAAHARDTGFTLDRVLAGRRQAAVRIVDKAIEITPLHDECPTYVLHDATLTRIDGPTRAQAGDFIVAGTSVVGIASAF